MNYKRSNILCILVLFSSISFGQEWIRIYGDSSNTVIHNVLEYYDKGYIFSGVQYNEGYTAYGWILKTDINGFEKWSRWFGDNLKTVRFFASQQAIDGSILEAGLYRINTGCSDPFLMKINVCGEKEWCKIYNAPYCSSTCYGISMLANGGIMALFDHWKSGEEETIWLFNLDSNGDVIWAQAYATDPEWNSEWSHSLLMTNDSCFVITGETYYPDPTYPSLKIIKIILIKVNLDGETIFEVPWGTNNGIYSDGRLSAIDSKNNIYTAGRRARKSPPYGDSPTLFKTSVTGQPVFYKDLKTTSSLGIATTVNWFQDSTLVECAGWVSGDNDTTALIKTDSVGTFIKQKALRVNTNNGSFYGSTITYNNRILLAGHATTGGITNGIAYKLTSDLVYDSIYTTPFTYDSLCPYPIVSDTIPLDDCEVVVLGIDDPVQNPEKTKLKVYPNPAGSRVTVEMPVYLVRTADGGRQTADGRRQTAVGSPQSAGIGITATTYYHQWKSVRLDVFDLFGKLMYSQDIPGKTDKIQLDVSSWPAGMYVARIVFMNDVVGVAKFVKE